MGNVVVCRGVKGIALDDVVEAVCQTVQQHIDSEEASGLA